MNQESQFYLQWHQWSNSLLKKEKEGLPWWSRDLESTCQCRGQRFDSRSRKIPQVTEQPSRAPQLVKPLHPGVHALQKEKPLQWEDCTPKLEKARMQQPRPSTVEKREIKNTKGKWIRSLVKTFLKMVFQGTCVPVSSEKERVPCLRFLFSKL